MKIMSAALLAVIATGCTGYVPTVSASLSENPTEVEIEQAKAELCAHIDASFTPFQSVRRQEAECLADADVAIRAKLSERAPEG